MPEGYESGTVNVPGIAGLGAGISFIDETGIDKIQEKEETAVRSILDGLSSIKNVTVYGPPAGHPRGAVISFNIRGMAPQDVAVLLDAAYGIAVRGGLHCAPDAHATIGTLSSGGTVRVSPNYFTDENEIESFIIAVEEIAVDADE
jgi:selenocysteine lyase/cysteine desulfurase